MRVIKFFSSQLFTGLGLGLGLRLRFRFEGCRVEDLSGLGLGARGKGLGVWGKGLGFGFRGLGLAVNGRPVQLVAALHLSIFFFGISIHDTHTHTHTHTHTCIYMHTHTHTHVFTTFCSVMKFFCSNLGAMLCNHGFEFARGMGGWVGLRNGWMAGWVDGRRDGWVAGGRCRTKGFIKTKSLNGGV